MLTSHQAAAPTATDAASALASRHQHEASKADGKRYRGVRVRVRPAYGLACASSL